MTSSEDELKKISTELSRVSLQICQLHERKKFLGIVQELRNRAEFEKTEEATENQHEIDRIERKLKELEDRQSELQQSHDRILNVSDSKNNTEGGAVQNQITTPTSSSVFYVEAPPAVPAPVVILDLENLPPHSCKTQCPECKEFVTTETFSSVSSVTWLMCLMTALIGCVAGCCLIPFCLDSLKSITHRCPKCRSSIKTLKKL